MNTNKTLWEDNQFRRNYNNQYYESKLKDVYKEKIECPQCKRLINLSSVKRHSKTEYHKKYSLDIEKQKESLKEKLILNFLPDAKI